MFADMGRENILKGQLFEFKTLIPVSMIRFLLFLVLNFGALAIGAMYISPGTSSDWYMELNKAQWSPPGWTFAVAWGITMLSFTWFLYIISSKHKRFVMKHVYFAFVIQWILNVAWNPVFFYMHQPKVALILISALLLVMIWFCWYGFKKVGGWALLCVPYVAWLIIATSLNAYIAIHN